jgi:hypothetical protein
MLYLLSDLDLLCTYLNMRYSGILFKGTKGPLYFNNMLKRQFGIVG